MALHKETQKAGGPSPAFLSEDSAFSREDPPLFSRVLRPYRSLSVPGFKRVLIFTTIGLSIPLLPVLGTPVGWVLLPFLLMSLLALYWAIMRNYRDAALHEELRLWPDLITVERVEPNGRRLRWHANPYWVRLTLHENARLESYLTLKGNGREIELGAFLSPGERVALHDALKAALQDARSRS